MTALPVLRPRADTGVQADTQGERILDLLRYEARPHTIRLHRHERLARFVSRADYAETIKLLLGFHRPIERWLSNALAAHSFELDLVRRAKVPLLMHDLTALGIRSPALRYHPAPLRTGAPYAMGWLYGIETISLGGIVMARRAFDMLGIGPNDGGAFFYGYGGAAPEAWRTFTAVLVHTVATDADRAAVLDGTADMFEALYDWLSLETPMLRAAS